MVEIVLKLTMGYKL